ncbi:MAG: hypothetical protein ACOCXZ_02520 [Chloroflexota bacterium]
MAEQTQKQTPGFTVGGYRISYTQNALLILSMVAATFTIVGAVVLAYDPLSALTFGVGAVIVHLSNIVIHQTGHIIAARTTGYPMRGFHFWGPLATSVYPRDEGDLPAAVHRRRALGGPLLSGVLAAIFFILLLLAFPGGGVPLTLSVLGLMDALLVFTIGALLPLKTVLRLPIETDGDTLVRWRRRGI